MQGISTASESPDVPVESHSPRTSSHKRSASVREVSHEPPTHRPKHDADDSLFCQESVVCSPRGQDPNSGSVPCSVLAKESSKGACPNQQKIDLAKTAEWETLKGKGAVTVWTGKRAKQIMKNQSHRFIGSRFAITLKDDEEGPV